MMDLLKGRDIYSEIKMLIEEAEQAEKNTDIYCELILQMFMRQSANN